MPSINDFIRSLGSDAALANVRAVLDQREREDLLLADLANRIEVRERAAVITSPAERTAA